MVRSIVLSTVYAAGLTLLSLAILSVGFAQVRSSSNYQLQSDSLNVGGGYSTSSNFQQESTIGEIATGRSTSTQFSLQAGYQQMQAVFISLSGGGNVFMDTDIFGLTGGISNGSTTFTVITDSPAGYQLTIEAENDPAMQRQGGFETIADYNPGPAADFTFTTGAGDAHFGFAPFGVDMAPAFQHSAGNVCGAGSLTTNLACWEGLSTTAIPIAIGGDDNHPTGATTTINFRVGVGSGAGVIAGTYIATTTVTALAL